jgi:pimeloyl-ACP methyl ester carboxylesterase
MTGIFIVAFTILALHLYRQYWAHKALPQIHFGSFDESLGDIYTVEDTVIAIQHGKVQSDKTVICFPGFTEDARYFQDTYKDCEDTVIFMGNAGYHSPFPLENANSLKWPKNPFKMGTISHDAFWVGQTIKSLAKSRNVVIHGHSRGGAVGLETGRQFPELTQSSVSLILEAAVVPKGKAAGPMSSKVAHILVPYLLPLLFALNRNITPHKLAQMPVMRPSNPLKADLLLSMFSTPQKYTTFVTNVKNIGQWQQSTSFEVYQNFKKVTALIGQRDDVLDCKTMIESVKEGVRRSNNMEWIQTKNTNHFITVEEPNYIFDALANS